ncbi:hypothetical protein OGAPHI_000447 [Ogataea philodendri]|uniref:Uncharacterized protein n=1 Tax=Ogataea philodendri TaxID=1378263 RepID=A0A9P8PI82_9ASCO|nr:uncharacterized protein OGAPHI_000447 [Ogataea philodendri]KAH3671742.1 hypothetical protein OGAPHI_000447 [Ogataea philodendri]
MMDVWNWTKWGDLVRVDTRMRLCVMELDVIEVCCVLERRDGPVQLSNPQVQVRILISDHLQVTLEVLDVDRIETDNCSIQSHIGLGEMISCEVMLTGMMPFLQDLLYFVQVLKQSGHLFFVNLLFGGESGLVDTIVNGWVNPIVQSLNLLLQVSREDVDLSVLLVQQRVESRIEDSDDLGRFVIDNCLSLGVPEHRNGKSSIVVLVCFVVQLTQPLVPIDFILSGPFTWVICRRESPSLVIHMPMNNGNTNQSCQSLQRSDSQCSVGPRTSK